MPEGVGSSSAFHLQPRLYKPGITYSARKTAPKYVRVPRTIRPTVIHTHNGADSRRGCIVGPQPIHIQAQPEVARNSERAATCDPAFSRPQVSFWGVPAGRDSLRARNAPAALLESALGIHWTRDGRR